LPLASSLGTCLVVPKDGNPTEGFAVNGYPPDGWERQVRGDQQLAGVRYIRQEPDTYTGRFFGVMLETVMPVGVIKPDCKYGVAGERQSFTLGRDANHTVSGRMAPGTTGDHAWR